MDENKQYNCGVLIGVNYKYGKTPHLFDDFVKTLSLIEQYPILISYLPQELKRNKQVVLTFIESNDKFVKAYIDAMDESATESMVTSSNVIRRNMADAFRNAYPKGMPNGVIDPFINDVDVLIAVENSAMWGDFYWTVETYNEKIVGAVASQAPQFACFIYDYWGREIKKQPKIGNSISVKYNLRADASSEIVALYKCIDILNTSQYDCTAALGLLITVASSKYWGNDTQESHKELAKIFRNMEVDMQNYLASRYYPLTAFVRADDLDETLAEEVAKNCPIASTLLPDSYVLKYNLQMLDVCEEDDICKKCGNCFWSNIRFV